MADGFHHLSRRAADLPAAQSELEFRASVAAAPPLSNELVARRYIDNALEGEQERRAFAALHAPGSPSFVPTLAVMQELQSPFGDGVVVRFGQIFRGVPVEGARAMVELSGDQGLSHLNLEVADEAELAESSPSDWSFAYPRIDRDSAPPGLPRLVFAYVPNRGFVLCWRFDDVERSRSPETLEEDVGGWESPRNRPARSDVYLDAYGGEVVLELSRSRAMAPFVLPIVCTGDSEDEFNCLFEGSPGGQGFQMVDPRRHTEIYDFGLQPYDLKANSPVLGPPVSHQTPNWQATNRAAVTANVNAQVVYDFLESLFHRQSIDGKQMTLVSVVNCARSDGNTNFPEAFWNGDRMLYGQSPGPERLLSMATHLDVVAHELCHGLTQQTANLRYRDESGALNESISDILGVIVANRTKRGQDARTWSWEIGPGLGRNGGPLRNMADPGGGDPPQPQHMNDYVITMQDNGGVHYNSGIHNHAAYRVLTWYMPDGSRLLTPDELAQMYYFILLQLTDNATFSDARRTLVESVRSRYQGLPDVAERVAALEAAYDTVGIA
jgi:hypothetical protein